MDSQLHLKLQEAQDLLRESIPDGDVVAIIDRALTELVRKLKQQRFALTDRPGRSGPAKERSRYIPADIRRAVYVRDAGQCTFTDAQGNRCSATTRLQYHHVKPFALGGESTVDNLALACDAHNAYMAELEFGPFSNSASEESEVPGPRQHELPMQSDT